MSIVRAATAEDARAMAEVHRDSFDRPWAAWEISRILTSAGCAGFLAQDDETLLGFGLVRVAGGEAEILTVAVRPDRRGQGLGRQLVQALAARAVLAGAGALILEVAVDNTAALRLYQRMGFETGGLRKAYYARADGSRVDASVMRLDLNSAGTTAYVAPEPE